MQKNQNLREEGAKQLILIFKLKTYLKYKYLLILKCDFRLLSGDPSDENEEKEDIRQDNIILRRSTRRFLQYDII